MLLGLQVWYEWDPQVQVQPNGTNSKWTKSGPLDLGLADLVTDVHMTVLGLFHYFFKWIEARYPVFIQAYLVPAGNTKGTFGKAPSFSSFVFSSAVCVIYLFYFFFF